MNIFARVHVEAGIQETAVPIALVGVTLDDLLKVQHWTGGALIPDLVALGFSAMRTELVYLGATCGFEFLGQRTFLCCGL